ncbi:MAG: PD-(D/E)XK nuclease family protein [Candidatus Eisenbacteria bacterium]
MNTITVIPLGENLLRRLADDIVKRFYSPDDPLALSKVTVILPHRRGTVYLRHYLLDIVNSAGSDARKSGSAREPKPLICPRIVTIEDFVNEAAVRMEERPGRMLSPTDQAWLLFGLAKDLQAYGAVASSWDRFFTWGVRLAGLLEEIDREMVDPEDIAYPEGVPNEARLLLEHLKALHEGFGRALGEHGFTTQAKRLRLVAERIADTGAPSGPMYLAGFYALSRCEDRLFRHFFDKGATIFWHADPSDLPQIHRRWRDDWHVEVAAANSGAVAPRPKIHFREAYDLHAELRAVQEIITSEISLPDQCALVLPDPSALIPTLYHIPQGIDLNISMGFPLERTSVATLLEELMALEESRNPEGAYYYLDYLSVVRHPYVRRLATPRGGEGRLVLHLLEEKVREYGKPYLTEDQLVEILAVSENPERDQKMLAAEGLDLDEGKEHLRQLHSELIQPWRGVKTPQDLAATVRRTVRFLLAPFLDQPAAAERALDNEFIYALEDQVIPGLEDALFAHQTMGKGLLFSLLRDLIHMTRVPFEGQPLKGLQLMGLLESRLLSFDKVIAIDVNEGIIPASEDVDPLLPESLRAAVGLPSRDKEEAITRYHFERLIGSAREVHLVWQSATTSSSGLDGKKTRSRFVESLLWNEERRAGRLLNDVVTREVLKISPRALLRDEGLVKTDRDNSKLREFILAHSARSGLSATLLNTYLRCPLQFYYRYILDLEPPESPFEDIDSQELGLIIHRALETYFKPYKNKEYVKARDGDPEGLVKTFTDLYKQSPMYPCLGPENRFFLERTVEHRLRMYLRQMPETTLIESLEQKFSATLASSLGDLTLSGKVDRIDLRDGYRIILDYKSGKVRPPAATLFETRLAGLALPAGFDYEGLRSVKEAVMDLQLPLYVLLVSSAARQEAGNILSAYVELQDVGTELYFVAPKNLEAVREAYVSWFARGFPGLLAYLVDHMIKSPYLYPATDERVCSFCDFNAVCSLSFA